MKFDKSSIAIRERSLGDILDLALRVVRERFLPLCGLLLIGTVPFAVLNLWLVPPPDVLDMESEGAWTPLIQHGLLMVWEAPLATAAVTLYLGQVLFWGKADRRSLLAGFFRGLPQLIFFQAVLRGLFLIITILWLFWCSGWVFISEIILLERTPFFGGGSRGAVSTERRRRILHVNRSGDLFGRSVLSSLCALALTGALGGGIVVLISILGIVDDPAARVQFFATLAAGWVAIGYLAVVRFLSYLDQRIRNEGWELELRMWAEKARLESESGESSESEAAGQAEPSV